MADQRQPISFGGQIPLFPKAVDQSWRIFVVVDPRILSMVGAGAGGDSWLELRFAEVNFLRIERVLGYLIDFDRKV